MRIQHPGTPPGTPPGRTPVTTPAPAVTPGRTPATTAVPGPLPRSLPASLPLVVRARSFGEPKSRHCRGVDRARRPHRASAVPLASCGQEARDGLSQALVCSPIRVATVSASPSGSRVCDSAFWMPSGGRISSPFSWERELRRELCRECRSRWLLHAFRSGHSCAGAWAWPRPSRVDRGRSERAPPHPPQGARDPPRREGRAVPM